MAKAGTAEKSAKSDAEQKTDGLEIISIGSLYNGPWDKKYWSSSRGKDRYPYPVGYQAVRVHNGTTFKMGIHEGVNGPNFLISSDDGSSSSGKTPDSAWEEFQKKGCPRMKIWHGKRLSSKMDGLELFGFRNPFIQRLLRELVADINGIAAGQSLVSSNICAKVSKTGHDDCHPNVGPHPDLLLCLGRSSATGKRSRRALKNKTLNRGAIPQSPELTCSRASDVKYEKSLGQESYTTHYDSEEKNGALNQTGVMSSVGNKSNSISSKTGPVLHPIDISEDRKGGAVPSDSSTGFLSSTNCKSTEVTENLFTENLIHRSHDVELKVSSLLVTPENFFLMQPLSKESQGCIDINLCALDTLPLVQDNTFDLAPSKLDTSAYHKVLKSNFNPSSEKSDFDSADQDVAKSMMSLLLPQAVPLLRNVSTDKEFTFGPSDMLPSRVNSKEEQNEVGYILDVPSSEDAYEKQGEKIHGPNTDPCSTTVNTKNMKSIVLDSFESSQCEDIESNPETLSSDITGVGRSRLDKEMCSLRSQEQLSSCKLPNGSSSSHALGLGIKDSPHDCDVCIPDSIQDNMSPKDRIIDQRRNDACSDLKENPVHVGFVSMQSDLSTVQDFTGGVSNAFLGVNTKIFHLKSKESLVEKMQDEVVGKTDNAETMITSSQLPNLVYTRRKLQHVVPLKRNCSVVETSKCDKIELVTTEMHTSEGTVPSETIQINNLNEKPCEPDDSAGLLVETPLTHNDVLIGHCNQVELNPASVQNPNPYASENNCSGAKETQFFSELMPHRNHELKNNLSSIVQFVGCYMHPMPVSSLFLSTREDEIHVCVICGFQVGQYRTLFTYKVNIKEPNLGCPSIMAHTSILLPATKHNFIRETMVERSGMKFTPDGRYIVLIGSIKTPNCREGKIDCYCSTCTSVCSEKNALKIIQVKHGYVSVVATLETVDIVHCILVCEPNRLVSVGESGRLQVWVMNSTWREKIECFTIPDDCSISPGIVELKRVPKFAHLVVGHNIYGEFSLWDIAKVNRVANFSTSKHPINEFFPISLFNWQTKCSRFSYAIIEEEADKLLEATNLRHSEQIETSSVLPSEEDVAMWLLVSTACDFDCFHNHVSTSSHCDLNTAGSWRLALLVKNSIIFGSPLDPRTTGIGILGGYGIIGTSDGVVYIWELSGGSKLGTLHHFQDGTVTNVATDDTRGALGVAGSGGQLLLYLHRRAQDSN